MHCHTDLDRYQEYLDPKLSKKILKIAREQQDEIEGRQQPEEPSNNFESRFPLGFDPSDDELDAEDMHGEYEELELDEEDDEILKQFLPAAPVEKRTLADLIMEKIEEKNAKDEAAANGEGEQLAVNNECSQHV